MLRVRLSSAPLAALGTPGRIRTDTGWCLRPLPLPLGYRGCRRLPGKACSARANLSFRIGCRCAGGPRGGQAGAHAGRHREGPPIAVPPRRARRARGAAQPPPPTRSRVVIAEDEALIRLDLKETLDELGYDVVGEAGDGEQAVALARELRPDLVILDVKMPVLDGISAAQRIAAARIAPVVILTAFSQRDLVERARDAGAMAYLVKPFSSTDLMPAIEMAISRYAEAAALGAEVSNLTEQLATRKVLDRAKGILQATRQLSEPEAFRWIQQSAMDQRVSMRAVADAVIASATRRPRLRPPRETPMAPFRRSGHNILKPPYSGHHWNKIWLRPQRIGSRIYQQAPGRLLSHAVISTHGRRLRALSLYSLEAPRCRKMSFRQLWQLAPSARWFSPAARAARRPPAPLAARPPRRRHLPPRVAARATAPAPPTRSATRAR